MDAAWLLAPVAVAMAAAIAALVRWAADARTRVSAAVVAFLLGMMVAMFVATWIYFSDPRESSLVIGLWVAAALMSVSLFPVVVLLLREAQDHLARGTEYRPRPLGSPAALAVTVTLLVLASELLMGRSFALATGSAPRTGAPLALLAGTVAGPWFLFPMAIEMSFSLVWLGRRFPGEVRLLLGAQSTAMLFGPPALGGMLWPVLSTLVSGAAMTAGLVVVVRAAGHARGWTAPVRRYAIEFLLVAASMGVGLGLWALGAGLGGFALATALQMAVFFSAIVVPEQFSGSLAVGRPGVDRADASG